jgi:hypothetical protein
MKTNYKYLFLIGLSFFTSCYKVNEYRFLFITFNSNLKSNYLKRYIEKVRNKNTIIPENILDIFLKGNKLSQNESFVYFSNNPKEWYLIDFDATPCWIESVYNKKLSNEVIIRREILGEKQIKRIQLRFLYEVLIPAEQYGISHHISSSIIYNK